MKTFIVLVSVSTLSLTSAFAQDRDYGNLVPNDYFSIKNSKTTLKEGADISNFEIKVTPEQEDFVYKVNGIKAPRKILFGKRSNFKLSVDKENGKVERISSVDFNDGEKNTHSQTAQSTSISENGYVNSRTVCSEDYKINFLGLKKKQTGFKCVTVNKNVCDYLVKNNIETEMSAKIKECSDLLGKLDKYQKELLEISKKDQSKDLKSITKLNGRLADAKNFYELQSSTLNDVADIAKGYSNAVSECNYLTENNYFSTAQESNDEPSHSGKPKATNQ